MASVSNQVPAYLIGHFFWTYALTSTRPLKGIYKIDHNVNPREDIDTYGEKAVAAGKITKAQLRMLKRNQASHANTIEHLPFFIGSVLLATVAKVDTENINRVCLIYTAARIVYHAAYLLTEKVQYTGIRSGFWWIGNLSCLWLLWQCKNQLA